jgi:hypothetical protein
VPPSRSVCELICRRTRSETCHEALRSLRGKVRPRRVSLVWRTLLSCQMSRGSSPQTRDGPGPDQTLGELHQPTCRLTWPARPRVGAAADVKQHGTETTSANARAARRSRSGWRAVRHWRSRSGWHEVLGTRNQCATGVARVFQRGLGTWNTATPARLESVHFGPEYCRGFVRGSCR